jgi:hypothetical protein
MVHVTALTLDQFVDQAIDVIAFNFDKCAPASVR